PGGDIVVAGNFTQAGSVAGRYLARWNGTTWSSLGSAPNDHVSAMTGLPNGDVIAGGMFTSIGGTAANHVARWNGATWSSLGAGMSDDVTALATMPNGDPVAASYVLGYTTQVSRWDGAAWQPLGPPMNNVVNALLPLPNGDLIAAGQFTEVGGVPANAIARWNGTAWSPLPGFIGKIWGLAMLPNGDLVAGGDNVVARWNGTTWSSLGSVQNGSVMALVGLPNGDVIAAGFFSHVGGVPESRIARWNGASWSAIGDGLNAVGFQLARLPNDDVLVAGNFFTAGGLVSPSLAQLSTTCPASAVSFGSGCVGSAGVNQLTATALPWIGNTYRARATGMPSNSFVAVISGFTPLAIPLSLFLGEAGFGCLGYVTGDVLEIALPTAGVVTTQVVVPNLLALVGAQFHQYVVPFEFDTLGALVAVTSSNALTVTVGHF
ncbi:MAG TPA: hypothetical protein VFT55_13940, partial [Planctomycetota bacterium]|nr:hypothetical protein [Planctomycetota bacterium]